MISAFDRIKLRLNRAEHHIGVLGDMIESFNKRRPYKSSYEIEPQPDGQIQITIKAEITEELSPDSGFIVAEIVHNLRASMDNAIWSVGQRYKASAKLSFPVVERENTFPLSPKYAGKRTTRLAKDLDKLPNAVKTIITDVQPYHRGDEAPYDILWTLNHLWNIDKHRAPVLVAGIAQADFAKPIPWGHGASFIGFGKEVGADYKNKSVEVTMDLPANATITPETNLEPQLRLKVVLDESTSVLRIQATDLLSAMHGFVDQKIVEQFKPYF